MADLKVTTLKSCYLFNRQLPLSSPKSLVMHFAGSGGSGPIIWNPLNWPIYSEYKVERHFWPIYPLNHITYTKF